LIFKACDSNEYSDYEETIEEESSEELGREETEETYESSDNLEKTRPIVPDIPKSEYTISKPVPAEQVGTGANKNLYFVCNNIEDEWTELPLITPNQIVISRNIRKYLTGSLDADIVSYPNFPGTEKNYLRALIARITSETHVSPMGFYKIDGNECEEDEDEEETGSAKLRGKLTFII
jgi:radial spoke head protein 4/6